MRTILSTLLLVLAPLSVLSLSCPDVCEPGSCLDPPTKCPYGKIKDSCNCCDYCGNGPGEQCGGEFHILGMCGKGLECISNNANEPSIFPEGSCVWKKKSAPAGKKQPARLGGGELPTGLKFVPRRQHSWMGKAARKKFGQRDAATGHRNNIQSNPDQSNF